MGDIQLSAVGDHSQRAWKVALYQQQGNENCNTPQFCFHRLFRTPAFNRDLQASAKGMYNLYIKCILLLVCISCSGLWIHDGEVRSLL